MSAHKALRSIYLLISVVREKSIRFPSPYREQGELIKLTDGAAVDKPIHTMLISLYTQERETTKQDRIICSSGFVLERGTEIMKSFTHDRLKPSISNP